MHVAGLAKNSDVDVRLPLLYYFPLTSADQLEPRCDVGLVSMLPDDVLLGIFDFCADEHEVLKEEIESWQTLVHVCRQWRGVVFGSPRRLNLRLVYEPNTPARDALDVWPALPLVIQCFAGIGIENVDNIVAVLKHSNRVCRINLLKVSRSDFENISTAMQAPFPELTHLWVTSNDETVPVLSESFLGGSGPRLRFISFHGIPFPGLPKLVLSATHLVDLRLYDIPHSGYFLPETMVTALSTLTSLQFLWLGFESPRSCPDQASRRPPLPTRLVLPVLKQFSFKGVGEYLEDFVARINAPRLSQLYMTFFNQIIFDTPQLVQFISRTPTLKLPENARVIFDAGAARVELRSRATGYKSLEVNVPCKELDWQISALEQICTLCLPPLSMLEDLYISEHGTWQPHWQDNIENTLWLELLHPFTGVKNLYLSEEFARRIVPALKELVEGRMTEVLPTLQNIFLQGVEPSGPVQEGIGQFVATRQVTSHPVAVSRWDRSSPSDSLSDSDWTDSDRRKDKVSRGRRLINALRLLPR
jgi:hypothetical protein